MTTHYDVVIVGAGGAGLTAALYASRAMLSTLVLEKLAAGGQIALTDEVENYPGFPSGVTGQKISEYMLEQAKKYGAQYETQEVKSLKPQGKIIEVVTDQGTLRAKAVIIASGASYRRLGAANEEALTGRGVSYCATPSVSAKQSSSHAPFHAIFLSLASSVCPFFLPLVSPFKERIRPGCVAYGHHPHRGSVSHEITGVRPVK